MAHLFADKFASELCAQRYHGLLAAEVVPALSAQVAAAFAQTFPEDGRTEDDVSWRNGLGDLEEQRKT